MRRLIITKFLIIFAIVRLGFGNPQNAHFADNINRELDPYQNDLLRETVNKAAGREIIPKDTYFELKSFTGTSTSSSVKFPDGGSAILSQSSYASNRSYRSLCNTNTLQLVVSLSVAAATILPLIF